MKTIFLSLSTLIISGLWANTRAQTIPNGTLDFWAPRNGVEAPINWQTTDDVARAAFPSPIPIQTGAVTKTTTVRSGSFAAQLQNQSVLGRTLPGVIVLGNSLSIGGRDIPGGLPFTGRPATLQFYYQLSGARAIAEEAGVIVQLTRRVNGAAAVVAEAEYIFPALAANYTLVTVPLKYESTQAPDSVSLAFLSGSADNLTPGAVLRIDDISFTGTATATRDAALAAAVSASPNPSPDGRFVLSTAEAGLLTAPLAVLDGTGRVVRQEAAPNKPTASRDLDLSNLPLGIYTVQLFTPSGVVTRKLSR